MSSIDKHDIDILTNKINIIEQKIDKVLSLLEKDCKKMSNHIDFVENVYENIKLPFFYLIDKINYLTLTNESALVLESNSKNNKI